MTFVNHLAELRVLRNRYVAVRHGESEANVAHVISSNPKIGCENHGLTEYGRTQVLNNSRIFLGQNSSTEEMIIISSDFRRARETAEILAAVIGEQVGKNLSIKLDQRLRERFFGIFDGKNDQFYEEIWKTDEKNPTENLSNQVESVESVQQRTTSVIREIEDQHENGTIFLVSHGDSLQILQTAFERMSNPNKQRDLPHLDRAEFRPLILK